MKLATKVMQGLAAAALMLADSLCYGEGTPVDLQGEYQYKESGPVVLVSAYTGVGPFFRGFKKDFVGSDKFVTGSVNCDPNGCYCDEDYVMDKILAYDYIINTVIYRHYVANCVHYDNTHTEACTIGKKTEAYFCPDGEVLTGSSIRKGNSDVHAENSYKCCKLMWDGGRPVGLQSPTNRKNGGPVCGIKGYNLKEGPLYEALYCDFDGSNIVKSHNSYCDSNGCYCSEDKVVRYFSSYDLTYSSTNYLHYEQSCAHYENTRTEDCTTEYHAGSYNCPDEKVLTSTNMCYVIGKECPIDLDKNHEYSYTCCKLVWDDGAEVYDAKEEQMVDVGDLTEAKNKKEATLFDMDDLEIVAQVLEENGFSDNRIEKILISLLTDSGDKV